MTTSGHTEATGLSDRLEACYTGAVYDVLRAKGYPNQVLPQTIRPLLPERKLAGKIYTISGSAKPNLDGHQTLLSWTEMLSRAPSGSVVMVQPNDSTMAHMGELSSETMTLRGVRGYIVDGGCRDSAFIRNIGFRVFCRYYTPVDVVGRWEAETFGEPIVIGGVTIHSGDYVLADDDGIVVIPGAMIEEVVTEVETVLNTESLVRKAILDGMDPKEAYLKYGKF
ncbi:MAG: RraA family protein [Verrucomicrobiae bacterium]|nr:RraA family protein [Verrucomicrobiae bacterium]NNJ43647.1 RraA family protein [Akkermansiaceae bacterium]